MDSDDQVVDLWCQWTEARNAKDLDRLAELDHEIRGSAPTSFDGLICKAQVLHASQGDAPREDMDMLALMSDQLDQHSPFQPNPVTEAIDTISRGGQLNPSTCAAAMAMISMRAAQQAYDALPDDADHRSVRMAEIACEATENRLCAAVATTLPGLRAQIEELMNRLILDEHETKPDATQMLYENLLAGLNGIILANKNARRDAAPPALPEHRIQRGKAVHDNPINHDDATDQLAILSARTPTGLLAKLNLVLGHVDTDSRSFQANLCGKALLSIRNDLKRWARND
jgi:hypothetical protein